MSCIYLCLSRPSLPALTLPSAVMLAGGMGGQVMMPGAGLQMQVQQGPFGPMLGMPRFR